MTTENIYDVIIIGAGVVGCAIARELSKYDLKLLLLEKENDVSCGASKANSGIVHGAMTPNTGQKKGYFSRKGNRMFAQLDNELNFGYDECGSMVIAFNEDELDQLKKLMANGKKNGVDDLTIIDKDAILSLEPNINPDVKYALYCPSAGITSPYEMTIALCENAIDNGVKLHLNEKVTNIDALANTQRHFEVLTKTNCYISRYIVNAAGINSDLISSFVGVNDFTINPRKGEYILLHKDQGKLINGVIFQAPTSKGKGILVTRTFHGNMMLGPNAQEVQDRNAIGTGLDVLEHIVTTARKSIPGFDIKYTLTSFAGLRASSSTKDFIIEETTIKGFINVAGIESPGLTSSPAIAVYVADILSKSGLDLVIDETFNPYRKSNIVPKDDLFTGTTDASDSETKLPTIADKHIICRCESVTEAEIKDALNRGIPIDHVDGIKRRTRATMGPCQGNYCRKRVAKVISDTLKIPVEDITLRGKHSLELPPRENRMFWKKLE